MNNSTAMNDTITGFDFSTAAIILILIVVVGGLGNTLTIYVICRYTVKSVTIIYIFSLAVADLTFLTTGVPLILSTRNTNFLVLFDDAGMLFFRLFSVLVIFTQATLHVTCWTLMAMTIDRYLAIVYPVKSLKWRTTKTSVKVSIGVWIVSGLLSLPTAFPYTPDSDVLDAVAVYIFLTSFGIPLLVIIICYVKIISFIHKRNKEMLLKGEQIL
ncbi:somatostatin receptor type 5-like isoform X5 [Saccostrea cucullata]|uniref:somatostatin receptor type 5-like isoform X5 n=1 Tax=Saccostrea cuccullata TaxID=36930 RepID=UPI002ED00876